MSETIARGGVEPTLRARGPAYSVMQECLRLQSAASPRGSVARFFGRSPLHPEVRSWYRGALGELEVAAILTRLEPEWTVLHAVPVGSGDSDIDHVLVGPGGIFTVNTKNHSGRRIWVGGSTFSVDGHKQTHMRDSRFEAARAAKLLSAVAGGPVPVEPLIVVVRPASISRGKKKPSVTVLASGSLYRFLMGRRRVHSDEAVAYLSMIAEERGTWHSRALVTDDTLRHVQRFERLQAEVESARRRLRLWLLLAMGALLSAPVLGVAIGFSAFFSALAR